MFFFHFDTEYYGTLAYFMADTLLDIMWSLICATFISVISYYLTNQPRQTDRFFYIFFSMVLNYISIPHNWSLNHTIIIPIYKLMFDFRPVFSYLHSNNVEFRSLEKRTIISIHIYI